MQASFVKNSDGSLSITLDFDPLEVIKLEDSLEGTIGIVHWVAAGPCVEKIKACAKRMDQTALKILGDDPTLDNIPKSPDGRITLLAKHPQYKNREMLENEARQREAEMLQRKIEAAKAKQAALEALSKANRG